MATVGNENGTNTGETLDPKAQERAWFCVRTRPKNEHIAAARLRELGQIDVFNPRIRFKRPRGRHTMWVTEALFPGYVFAKFNWRDHLKLVHYTNGVTGVVHFGYQYPIIDQQVITEWQNVLGEEEMALVEDIPQPGEEVLVTGGAFKGTLAQVVRVTDSKRRIAVLMEFLGRQVMMELSRDQYVRPQARGKISLEHPEE
ncbi:MAG TPA: hypothetical protein DCY13_09000 [Verrucomicrobiales bacterium]|nr:hypothetical protein [Verrucomicrobiales bacterium]